MNTTLDAVTDADERPIHFVIAADHSSGHTGAAATLSGLPAAEWLPGDSDYDAVWFREAWKDKG